MGKKSRPTDYAKALGASVVIPLGRSPSSPLDLMAFSAFFSRRLVSRGGRPTDPSWDTKRLVPFRKETWRRLTEEARRLSGRGRKLGPAQLAAMLIERQLEDDPSR